MSDALAPPVPTGPHGHKGFVGGLVYCPTAGKRVKMDKRHAGFFICPGCGQRIEGLKWS